MLSIDANILVYSTDSDDPAKQAMAIDLLIAASRIEAGLTEQCIVEFVNTAIRKTKAPIGDITTIVREWLKTFTLLVPTVSVVEDTLALLDRHKLSAWDARLLAVCGAHGCDILFSEDMQDGASYNGVRVINPFAPKNRTLVRETLFL